MKVYGPGGVPAIQPGYIQSGAGQQILPGGQQLPQTSGQYRPGKYIR